MSAGLRGPEGRWLAAAALGLLASLASPVRAHGPAPAPLRVLAAEGERATLIQTNIGLAIHSQGGIYRYGCPSLWGGAETPLMAADEAGTLFVVGASALHASSDRACNVDAALPDGLVPSDVTALAAAGPGRALLLARGDGAGGDGARLYGWTPGEVTLLRTWPGVRLDSLAVRGDAAALVGARPSPQLWTGPASGEGPWAERTLTIDPEHAPQRLSVRAWSPDGGALHLAAVTDAGAAWLRAPLEGDGEIPAETLASGERSVHGPAPLCGGLFALVDNEPVPDPTAPPACDLAGLEGQRLTCLGATGGFTWTCRLRALERVDVAGEGAALTPWFSLDALVGPWPGCPDDPVARAACQQDWLHYGAEAGLLDPDDLFGLDAPDVPAAEPDAGAPDAGGGEDAGVGSDAGGGPPPRSADEGCRAAPGRAGAPWVAWALLVVWTWRR